MVNCILISLLAQSVERPSKVPIWCNSTWARITPRHKVVGKNPCSVICYAFGTNAEIRPVWEISSEKISLV